MIADQRTLKIIADWVTRLADVTSHGAAARPDRNAIASYAAVLGQTFPSGAFTAASLEWVTRGREWFPAVGVLSPVLAEWWNANRPQQAKLIGFEDSGRPEGWTAYDQGWLDFWLANIAEAREKTSMRRARGPVRDETQLPTARLASLVRRYGPLAWSVISADGLREAA